MSERAPRSGVLALAGAVLLVLTACAETSGPSAGGGGDASINITSPKEDDSVKSPVELVVSVQGVQLGTPEQGMMHLHVHVDGASDFTVVTSTQAKVPVPAGEHTLQVVLAEPNHNETGAADSVSISVAGGAGQPSPDDGGDGYGGGYG